MRKNKGFTLIEIIICIALISIIATTMTITIVKNKRKNELNILEKNSTKLENALQVYLANHKEVTYNLKNNTKAAAITLEVLKNEGLIDDTLKIDNYKKKYFLVSNAKLLETKDGKDESDCENDVVGVEIFKSWDLSKDADGSKVIYVCPKTNESDSSNSLNDEVNDLKKKISELESKVNNVNIGEKNYVLFDVNPDSTKLAYFSNSSGDVWRIIKNSSSNTISLFSNDFVRTNYSNTYKTFDEVFNSETSESNKFRHNKKGDIIEYLGALTNDDCINNKHTFHVKNVSSALIEDYYSYDTSRRGIESKIENIYYNNNKFYKIDTNVRETSCYVLSEIDVDSYLDADFRILKNDFNSYYYDEGRYYTSLPNENELDYISIFDLNNTNPFKSDLLTQVNPNLKQYLKQSKKSYFYKFNNNSYYPEDTEGESNNTYFRTITLSEIEENKLWLQYYYYPIGYYSNGGVYKADKLNTKKITNENYFIKMLSVFNFATSTDASLSIFTFSQTTNTNGSSLTIYSKNYSYMINGKTYYPIIDLSITNQNLLTDINSYSSEYKKKYSTCTSKDLGTLECPYLIKFPNGYFSDGTTT